MFERTCSQDTQEMKRNQFLYIPVHTPKNKRRKRKENERMVMVVVLTGDGDHRGEIFHF